MWSAIGICCSTPSPILLTTRSSTAARDTERLRSPCRTTLMDLFFRLPIAALEFRSRNASTSSGGFIALSAAARAPATALALASSQLSPTFTALASRWQTTPPVSEASFIFRGLFPALRKQEREHRNRLHTDRRRHNPICPATRRSRRLRRS